MKKKLLVLLTAIMMVFGLAACGSDAADDTDKAAVATDEVEVVADDSEEVAEDVEFSLLDVSSDMIEFCIYAEEDDGTEDVIAGFTGPDGNSYVCVMTVFADGTGDVVCGAVTDVATLEDEDGTQWSCFEFTDAYTGTECTAVFADFDDGSVMISNDDLSWAVAGEYIETADEAIDYMAAAASFIE